MLCVLKELSELSRSRVLLLSRQRVLQAKQDEVQDLLFENTQKVEEVISKISSKSVLCALAEKSLSVEEALLLLSPAQIWEYTEKEQDAEDLDDVFNCHALHKGILEYFNPSCEWFVGGTKMPMFKADEKWEVTWKFVNPFCPVELKIGSSSDASGIFKLFGHNTADSPESYTEALLDEFELHKFSDESRNLLCFSKYDTYHISVDKWVCTGWVCQIVLK